MARNLTDESIIEWAASWVRDEPEGERERFAKALREELQRRIPGFGKSATAATSDTPKEGGSMVPHDYVTLYVFGSVNESKDTISQCARCGTTKHDYEYDHGKRSPNYPMFHRLGRGVEEGDCTRGDMTEERAAFLAGIPATPTNGENRT